MALSIHDFTSLMLAQMARASRRISARSNPENIASIPFNYRERIECILCADNGWQKEFSVLINVREYFENHFKWEERLAEEIQEFSKQSGRKMYFDIVKERIMVKLREDDIKSIIRHFDKETTQKMEHFIDILLSSIYSREHQERIFNYTPRNIDTMLRMQKNYE